LIFQAVFLAFLVIITDVGIVSVHCLVKDETALVFAEAAMREERGWNRARD